MTSYFSTYGPVLFDRVLEKAGIKGGVNQKDRESGVKCTFPDSIYSGPVLSYSGDLSISSERNPNVSNLKNLTHPFPIRNIHPGAVPFPSAKEAGALLNPVSGNSLSYYESEGCHHLLSAHQGKEDKVDIILHTVDNTPLGFIEEKRRDLISLIGFDHLSTVVINDEPLGFFQAGYKAYIANLYSNDMLKEMTCPNCITDGCLHPRFKGYYAIALEDGSLDVSVCDRNVPIWTGKVELLRSKQSLPKCQFGNDPFSMIVSSSSEMWAYDFRSNCSRQNIFNSSRYSDHPAICDIISFSSVMSKPYIYVNTSDLTCLLDERYCKYPIQIWRPMMKGKADFPHVLSSGDTNVFAMVDKHSKKLCLMANKFESNNAHAEARIESLSTPKHFKLIDDTLDFAQSNNLWYNCDVLSRIDTPWVGFTLGSVGSDNSFKVFVQSNIGDIYYQSFLIEDFHDSKPKVSQELLLSKLKKFENQCSVPNKIPFSDMVARDNNKIDYSFPQSETSNAICEVNEKQNSLVNGKQKMQIIDNDISIISSVFPEATYTSLSKEKLAMCKDPLAKKISIVWENNCVDDDIVHKRVPHPICDRQCLFSPTDMSEDFTEKEEELIFSSDTNLNRSMGLRSKGAPLESSKVKPRPSLNTRSQSKKIKSDKKRRKSVAGF